MNGRGATSSWPRLLDPVNAKVVFSDVDETIIRGKSLIGFAEHLARSLPSLEQDALRQALKVLYARLGANEKREVVNRAYYESVLGNRTRAQVRAVARAWFDESCRERNFFKQPVCRFLSLARAAGARVVLLSGSFSELIEPIAEFVGAADILAAPLECVEGRFTGRLLGVPTVEQGKLGALSAYVGARNLSLSECAGVGDDLTDLPFLAAMGKSLVPADGHPELVAHAVRNGWRVLTELPPLALDGRVEH